MLKILPRLKFLLSFCHFSVSRSGLKCTIPEHADHPQQKAVFLFTIPEHADHFVILCNPLLSSGFRVMLTTRFKDLFYIYCQVQIKLGNNMAGKTSNMSVIKEVLRQHFEKKTPKLRIARNLGVSRNTVKKYIHLALADVLDYKSLIQLDTPVLEHRLLAGTPAYTEKRYDSFKEEIPYYLNELEDKHVTLRILWEEYIARNPEGYKYSQFCYHITQAKKKKPSVVTILTDKFIPGEKLFVDFAGDPMYYVDHTSGELIKCQIFIACLPYSDYTFAIAVPSQCQEDFMFALVQCFKALGGVPEILVTDNLKAAVIKPSYNHAPVLNALMAEVGLHYNCSIIPTKPYSPTHKAKVESQVRIIYNRVYASLRKRTFFSIYELNTAIAEKVLKHNQTRMQDRTYSREEHFISHERKHLQVLPENDFQITYQAKLKVQNNCCIKLVRDKHYYSVPFQYVGQTVLVEYTRTLVKVFLKGKGTLIATHLRDYKMGGYTTCDKHLASNSLAMLNRTAALYVERSYKKSPLLGELIDKMLSQPNTPAEFYYKTCDALLHMENKDQAAYNYALQMASEHHIFSYVKIKSIYKTAVASKEHMYDYEDDILIPNNTENLRGQSYYSNENINSYE